MALAAYAVQAGVDRYRDRDVAFRRERVRTYVRALGIADGRAGRPGPPPGLRGGRRPPLRRTRGPQHPLPRDPRQVGAEQGARSRSRVPFSWTVNPYRGCSHSCTYCAMGRNAGPHGRRPDPRRSRICGSGDEIIGTERRGRYRRYVRTRVLDHWSTIKPVWEVKLEDGTRLLTSGDHRFLTERGWKHVDEHAALRARPAAPDDEQRAAGHRPLRRPAAADRGLQARLPVRPDPRRRPPAGVRVPAPDGRIARRHTASGSRSTDFEALRRAQHVPRGVRRRDPRVRLRGGGRRPPRDRGRSAPARGRRSRRSRELIRVPVRADQGLAQGLPRRDLRRRGLVRPAGAADLATPTASSSTGRRSRSTCSGSTPSSRTTTGRTSCASCGSAAG